MFCVALDGVKMVNNPFLSKLCQSSSGLPWIHWRGEDSAVDEVEGVEDAVEVAVLDEEAVVGGSAGGAGVVGNDRMGGRDIL